MSKIDKEWKNRVLCSDGNCIGVIGPDGLCKECGKKYEGKLPEGLTADKDDLSSEQTQTAEDSSVNDQSNDDQSKFDADSASEEETVDDDWAKRQLCSDGNCIGVIGPDGRCKECGKPLE